MDDDAKTLIKIGTEVALRPVTAIAEDALGLMGGDWLSETRKRNRERLKARTDEILRERNVETPEEPSPSIAIPLLSHAQEESREELVDLWAKLLACAMDPAKKQLYRREYVDIVSRLEPLDATLLEALAYYDDGWIVPSREKRLAEDFAVSCDRVRVCFRNLTRLELIEFDDGPHDVHVGDEGWFPRATALAREMLEAINASEP